MIELRHLRYFTAVARYKHFTQAAHALHVSQPALSTQIRKLESHLRVRLLRRSKRKVEVTDAGNALLRRAESILKSVGDTEAEMKEFSGLTRGSLVVGALPILGEIYFPSLLQKLRRRFPGIEIVIREESNERLVELLHSGECDLALIDTALMAGRSLSGFRSHHMFRSRATVFMSREHRLAGRKRLALKDLRDEQFIFFNQGSSARYEVFHKACMQRGFLPKTAFHIGQASLVFELVARGFGVTIAPAWTRRVARARVAGAEISDAKWIFDVALVWAAGRNSPVLSAFLSLAGDRWDRRHIGGVPTANSSAAYQ